MAKDKTVFLCNDCGYESPKWSGKCPACGAWNTFVEKVVRASTPSRAVLSTGEKVLSQPVLIDDVAADRLPRMDMQEM